MGKSPVGSRNLFSEALLGALQKQKRLDNGHTNVLQITYMDILKSRLMNNDHFELLHFTQLYRMLC